MAQKVSVTLVDDIDGGVASETVSFALDGTAYEIDLSADNARALRDALSHYVGAGRKVRGRAGGGGASGSGRQRRGAATAAPESSGTGAAAGRTADIRDWARGNGYTVSERGRISASVLEAYERAH